MAINAPEMAKPDQKLTFAQHDKNTISAKWLWL
jgi:hypothetical protein